MSAILPGNPHDISIDFAETMDARVVASAVLALTHEQRTANLIAIAVAKDSSGYQLDPQLVQWAEGEVANCIGWNGETP